MEMRQRLRQKREQIIELAGRHGAREVRIFGSVARGDAGEDSDVDLLVQLDAGRTLLDLGGLTMDLRDLLGVDVHVLTEGSLYGRFGQMVSREAIAL